MLSGVSLAFKFMDPLIGSQGNWGQESGIEELNRADCMPAEEVYVPFNNTEAKQKTY